MVLLAFTWILGKGKIEQSSKHYVSNSLLNLHSGDFFYENIYDTYIVKSNNGSKES